MVQVARIGERGREVIRAMSERKHFFYRMASLSLAAFWKGNGCTRDVLRELVHHPSIDLDVKHKDGLTIDDMLR